MRYIVMGEGAVDLNEFQDKALTTAIYPGQGTTYGLAYVSLGLVGEAGEVANKAKKVLRDAGGNLSNEAAVALAHEAGDVLWYLAMLCEELDVTMEDIAEGVLAKLRKRAEEGKLQGSGDDR